MINDTDKRKITTVILFYIKARINIQKLALTLYNQ